MRLQTKQNQLTAYAFSCGYTESRGGFTISREHGVYHIKGFGGGSVRQWETARTLTEARRALRNMKGVKP